jgi:low affinity Fe/Cu permease
MLAAAVRLARLITAVTDRAYLERRARAAFVTSAAWLVAGLMVLAALFFALVTVFAALLEVMPAWGAALIATAIAVIVAGIAILVANRTGRHESLPQNETLETLTRDPQAAAAAAMAPLIDEALQATRERPSETLALALAAGLIAGRLLHRPKSRPAGPKSEEH